jgi:4-amino-4-deoxy-L-arabinose transferase-like glycosyltransferase
MKQTMALRIFCVAGAAFLTRLFLFGLTADHPEVYFQPDSTEYVKLAEGLKHHGGFSYPEAPTVPKAERMPGYPAFLAAAMPLCDGRIPCVVLIQMLLDTLTCLVVYILGERACRGAGFLSGMLAALNPGMIAYCQFLLTDSLFLFIFTLGLLWLTELTEKPDAVSLSVFGALLGASVWVRPVTTYLPFVLTPVLLGGFLLRFRLPALKSIGLASIFLASFLAAVTPWLIRNYVQFGAFRLNAQAGNHLLHYIAPFFWQNSKGIPYPEGNEKAREMTRRMVEEMAGPDGTVSPFDRSDAQVRRFIQIVKAEPLSGIAKAWISGIIKNLGAPAIVDISYLLRIERPHFYDMKGETFLERSWHFLAGSGAFGGIVILNMALTAIFRVLQLAGLIQLCEAGKWSLSLVYVTIILYFLLISGPVGYAKYRLPFEPILMMFTAMGIQRVIDRARRATRPQRAPDDAPRDDPGAT